MCSVVPKLRRIPICFLQGQQEGKADPPRARPLPATFQCRSARLCLQSGLLNDSMQFRQRGRLQTTTCVSINTAKNARHLTGGNMW